MVVAISAIWAFYFTQNISATSSGIPDLMFIQFIVLGGITSVLIGLWRWIHHVYDNDICRQYPEAVLYETNLGMNANYGYTGYLLGQAPWIERKPDENAISWTNRIREYVGKKRIGMRGKLRWTLYSTVIILAFTSISLYIVFWWGHSPTSFTGSPGITIAVFILPYTASLTEIGCSFWMAQKDYPFTPRGIFRQMWPV